MHLFPSLHPRDLDLTPEQGGLTYPEIRVLIDAARDATSRR